MSSRKCLFATAELSPWSQRPRRAPGLDDAPEEAQRMGTGELFDAFLTASNEVDRLLPAGLTLSVV